MSLPFLALVASAQVAVIAAVIVVFVVGEMLWMPTSQAVAAQLARDPSVLAASPSYIRSVQDSPPNDPMYAQQWWLPKIGAQSIMQLCSPN